MSASLERALSKAEQDDDILALVVYGSYARDEDFQDIDVALVVWPNKLHRVNTLQKEIDYSFDGLDVHVFQKLPLYIQSKVIEEGDIRIMKSYEDYFDFVMMTLRKWSDFKHIYFTYLEGVLSEPKDSS